MDEKIIAIFCLCDDLLKAIEHQKSAFPQQLNDAEVLTIALVAASCFQGRHDSARFMLAQHGYMGRLSKSRFNRRLHRLKETVASVFDVLGQMWKPLDTDGVYVIDSFPVAVCDNIRIRRAKLYRHEAYRGYQASKRRYFYGLKIHLMVTSAGQPVDCVLTPGSVSDVQVLKAYAYDLPPGSVVVADKAYNDYEIEDLLAEVEHIRLPPVRKKNSRRPNVGQPRFPLPPPPRVSGGRVSPVLGRAERQLPDTPRHKPTVHIGVRVQGEEIRRTGRQSKSLG